MISEINSFVPQPMFINQHKQTFKRSLIAVTPESLQWCIVLFCVLPHLSKGPPDKTILSNEVRRGSQLAPPLYPLTFKGFMCINRWRALRLCFNTTYIYTEVQKSGLKLNSFGSHILGNYKYIHTNQGELFYSAVTARDS